MKNTESQFDYVIVGAGSAGCVLAARLTENPDVRVALLEAGGSDRNILIQMPTALSYPMNMAQFNWGFESEPEPHLDNRRMDCPRGKVLGGSSSINGMVFVRGHACDINAWDAAGAAGWNYPSCLPYYKKMETWIGGADKYRGNGGPLSVCAGNNMKLNPLYERFIAAGSDAGYPKTKDYNGYQQEGFGQMHMSVKNGVRWSTANAYLKPAKHRSNLTVIPHTLVDKLMFDKNRVIGVRYFSGGRQMKVFANTEVILSAGSIGSPSILQRSGIGPAQVLEQAGVGVRVDSAGVGENLQDHLEVYFQYRCKQPVSLNRKLGLVSKGLIGAQWVLNKSGLGATNHFESCAFIRSRAGLQSPNVQYHFLPGAMRYDGRAAFAGDGYQVHVGPNTPLSRGRVAIKSDNPAQQPSILFNYLQHQQDVQDWRDTIKLTREILGQDAMLDYRGEEIQPGSAVQTDEQIDTWVRQNVESAYHPSCTVKMGATSDNKAVLDEQCKVRGMESLRVVDSSIFPSITNGNLNAPTIMVAERAADIIKGDVLPADTSAKVWIANDWENQQRSKTGTDLPGTS